MMACSACERRRQKIRELAAKAKRKLFPVAEQPNSDIKPDQQPESAPESDRVEPPEPK